MSHSDDDPGLDPEIGRMMAELLDQTSREPVSPRLLALARQLEAALAAAGKTREEARDMADSQRTDR